MNGFEDYPVQAQQGDAENEYSTGDAAKESLGDYVSPEESNEIVAADLQVSDEQNGGEAIAAPETNAEKPEEDESKTDREIALLCRQLPELTGGEAMTAVKRERYGELRALGLSAKEAYLATKERGARPDNRSHLQSSVPKGSNAPKIGMSASELLFARELFGTLSDTEIKRLYQRVTK